MKKEIEGGEYKIEHDDERCYDAAVGNQSWYKRCSGWREVATELKAEQIYELRGRGLAWPSWGDLTDKEKVFWIGRAGDALRVDDERINKEAMEWTRRHFTED